MDSSKSSARVSATLSTSLMDPSGSSNIAFALPALWYDSGTTTTGPFGPLDT